MYLQKTTTKMRAVAASVTAAAAAAATTTRKKPFDVWSESIYNVCSCRLTPAKCLCAAICLFARTRNTYPFSSISIYFCKILARLFFYSTVVAYFFLNTFPSTSFGHVTAHSLFSGKNSSFSWPSIK